MPPQDPYQNRPAEPQPSPGPSALPNMARPNRYAPNTPPQPYVSPAPVAPAPLPQIDYGRPRTSKKKLWIVIIILLLAAALIFVLRPRAFTLESYSNDVMSILAPKPYETLEGESGVLFKESGGDEATRSKVTTSYTLLTPEIVQEQKEQLKRNLHSQLVQNASDSAKGLEGQMKNEKVVESTFNGDEGFTLTADIFQREQKIGTIKSKAALSNDTSYSVSVVVHNGDTKLSEKVDTIIDSFKLK